MRNYRMDIFESLESLPVSEGCFEDIIGLVESKLREAEEGVSGQPNNTPNDEMEGFRKFKAEVKKKAPWLRNVDPSNDRRILLPLKKGDFKFVDHTNYKDYM